jgi:hypothetical protein
LGKVFGYSRGKKLRYINKKSENMSSIEGGLRIDHSETERDETIKAWLDSEQTLLEGYEGKAGTVAKLMSLTSEAAARSAAQEQA